MLRDSSGPGIIGKMGEGLSTAHLFWRLVKEYGLSIAEVELRSFDMMMEAVGYLDMRIDYRNAWQAFYEIENERKAVNRGENK